MKINLNRKISALVGTFIIAGTMSGCRAKCDIEGEHSHLYKTSSGYSAYVDSEEDFLYGFTRYDDYKDDVDPIDDYAFHKELLRIDDNQEIIDEKISNDSDYYISHLLSRNVDLIHHMYKAYKVVEVDGKYEIIPSELVDDLNSIKDEYPYIEVNFTHLINTSNGKDIGTEGVEIYSRYSKRK